MAGFSKGSLSCYKELLHASIITPLQIATSLRYCISNDVVSTLGPQLRDPSSDLWAERRKMSNLLHPCPCPPSNEWVLGVRLGYAPSPMVVVWHLAWQVTKSMQTQPTVYLHPTEL